MEAVVVASLSTGLNLNLRPVEGKDMEEGDTAAAAASATTTSELD